MIRDIVFGFIGLVSLGLVVYFFFFRKKIDYKTTDIEATTIQKSIQSISKLMVTEGHYSEVYSYQEKNKVFFNLIPTEKKALIILNAKVQVGYDLKKLEFVVNKDKKQVIIKYIPEEEVNIIPELKFYDIQASTFNTFTTQDLNKVQEDAIKVITEKISNSDIKLQSRQRLVESLMTITNVSQALGWTMVDKTNTIQIELLK